MTVERQIYVQLKNEQRPTRTYESSHVPVRKRMESVGGRTKSASWHPSNCTDTTSLFMLEGKHTSTIAFNLSLSAPPALSICLAPRRAYRIVTFPPHFLPQSLVLGNVVPTIARPTVCVNWWFNLRRRHHHHHHHRRRPLTMVPV